MITLTIPYSEYANLRAALILAKCNADARAQEMERMGVAALAKSFKADAAEADRLREMLIRTTCKQEA